MADFGRNRFVKKTNDQDYTSSMCENTITGKLFDGVEHIECVERPVRALLAKFIFIAICFEKRGLLSGYNDVRSHFHTTSFKAVTTLRDINLPQINKSLSNQFIHC